MGGLGECGASASCPATAEVGGRTYSIGVVGGISVSDDDLSPYAHLGKTNSRGYFLDDVVYAIRDVDPETLLLVRASPNLQNDAGSWGPYVGLWGNGQDADIRRYFERGSARPSAE